MFCSPRKYQAKIAAATIMMTMRMMRKARTHLQDWDFLVGGATACVAAPTWKQKLNMIYKESDRDSPNAVASFVLEKNENVVNHLVNI